MIRVTTNSTLHMYQSNLMQSSNQLYSAMEKLMTGRNFDSYASDPAAATRAFKLHSCPQRRPTPKLRQQRNCS